MNFFKAKNKFKKLIFAIMVPWGIIILVAIIAITVVISSIIGFLGDNTLDDNISSYDNGTLNYYLKQSVNNANGPMDDYYGYAKKLALTNGSVAAYIKYSEIENGKDMSTILDKSNPSVWDYAKGIGSGIINKVKKSVNPLGDDEKYIDNAVSAMKPTFTYKDDKITTVRKYKAFDTKVGISGVTIYKSKPGDFNNYVNNSVGTKYYIVNEDTTYIIGTTTNNTFNYSAGTPSFVPSNVYIVTNAYHLNANYYDVGDIIYINSTNETYTVKNNDSSDNSNSDDNYFDVSSGKPGCLNNLNIVNNTSDIGSASNYNVNKQIYDIQNSITYTVSQTTSHIFNSSAGKPAELNGYTILDNLPNKFNANNYNSNDKFYVVSNNTAYTVVDKTDTTYQSIKLLTYAHALRGTFNISYKNVITHYTTKINDPDKDGNYTVTKPELDQAKQSDQIYDPLKNIISSNFPNENDIESAAYMIINGTNNYNNKKQDGDWINQPVNLNIDIFSLASDETTFVGDIPLFLQGDSRWGNYPYEGKTIAYGGCGVTSLAMVVTGLQGNLGNYDINHDGIFDPEESAIFSTENGYAIDGEGTSWGLFSFAASKFGLTCTQYSPSQYSSVLSELRDGHPVIASMNPGDFTSSGHFIVLTGVTADGKITVNDPASQERSNKTWDFNSIIVPQAAQFWAFNNPNIVYKSFQATAYTGAADEGGTGCAYNGYSLSGKDLRDKYIAVDPSAIALGSKVKIRVPDIVRYQTMPDGTKVDMDGTYIAVDTGSAIKGNIIDIYFGTGDNYVRLCDNFGRQPIQVSTK